MAGRLAVLGLMLTLGARAQGPGKMLAEMGSALAAGGSCLSAEERSAAADDVAYLRARLGSENRGGPPWQMPEDYRRSLRAAYDLVRAGGCDNLKAVADDLHLKRLDCQQSGAARTIPVRISTRRAGGDDPGWQVWSVWVPQSRLLVGRVPLKTLSSPAQGELVPGRYRFVARKGGREVEGGPYTIYGKDVYPVEIPVE